MDAASRIRNQIMLMRGRGSDSLPGDNRELASLAELLDTGPESPSLTCRLPSGDAQSPDCRGQSLLGFVTHSEAAQARGPTCEPWAPTSRSAAGARVLGSWPATSAFSLVQRHAARSAVRYACSVEAAVLSQLNVAACAAALVPILIISS